MTRQSASTMLVILRAAMARLAELRELAEGPERAHVLVALKECYALAGPSSSWVIAATRGASVPPIERVEALAGSGGHLRTCPECGGVLARVDGCTKCLGCGWLGSCG